MSPAWECPVPAEPEFGGAWQTMHISRVGIGAASRLRVDTATNDDRDIGYDNGRVERWSHEYATQDEALVATGGGCRIGISGVIVHVYQFGRHLGPQPSPWMQAHRAAEPEPHFDFLCTPGGDA